jgi:hypothetical protein
MNPPTGGMDGKIILPPVLAIGFTGHRHLTDEAKSRTQIFQFLKEKKGNTPGLVYGVSSAAAGGDLLFAESCIQLGLPLRILLPMAKDQFHEDFDEPTWQRVENVLSHATSVEVTGSAQPRDAQYYECGVETVLQSRLLLALWDGEPSRGLGGTKDILDFAKVDGRPVVRINSKTGEIERFNEDKEALKDPELDFLNALPDPEVKMPTQTPGDLARAWFDKIDKNATLASPYVRRKAAIPILSTAAASVLSTIGTIFPTQAIVVGVGAVLSFTVGTLPALLRVQKSQIFWARTRTATEICRSNLAFWKIPALYNVIGPEVIPELSGMLTSLNFQKMLDSTGRKASVDEFKDEYRKKRMQGQIDYFEGKANQSDKRAKQYKYMTSFAILVAVIANIWILKGLDVTTQHGIHLKALLSLAGSVFFQIATILGALLVVNDYQRRRVRYRELHEMLKEWDKQLEFARTWPIVIRIAERVEKALLAEVIEWRSLVMHHKMPRR